MKDKVKWLVAALVVAVGTIAGACGGDGDGEELTLEEYFQKVQAVVDEHMEQNKAIVEDLRDVSELAGDIETFEEAEEKATEALAAMQSADIHAIDEMDDINPPAEIEDAHNEFVDAKKAVYTKLYEEQGAFELSGESELLERLSAACLRLEEIAADNGISVDLGCED
jgi:hypothetical protein